MNNVKQLSGGFWLSATLVFSTLMCNVLFLENENLIIIAKQLYISTDPNGSTN